jgi:endonuclease YncB( thermonuclease family)
MIAGLFGAIFLITLASTAIEAKEQAIYSTSHLTFKRPFTIDKTKVRIVDGDSWYYRDEEYRGIGYDTPEVTGCEKPLGVRAREEFKSRFDASPKVQMQRADQREKYGRRLSRMFLWINGKRIEAREWLINNQLAHPYDGTGKRPPWPCAE